MILGKILQINQSISEGLIEHDSQKVAASKINWVLCLPWNKSRNFKNLKAKVI